jgi:hypothetical protein
MLAIDFEIEKEGMTVPYPPLFNDSQRNHGFVDLRGRPDLAIEIPESSQSPTLKAILVEFIGARFTSFHPWLRSWHA